MLKKLLLPVVFIFSISKNCIGQTIPPPPPTQASTDSGDSLKIFEKVDKEASVDKFLWRDHLQRKLTKAITKASRKGMPPGEYTINVRFLVEKDGTISSVTALNDLGYGLAKAAEDVIKSGPRWRPGEQNGKKVRSYHVQPISFVIAKE